MRLLRRDSLNNVFKTNFLSYPDLSSLLGIQAKLPALLCQEMSFTSLQAVQIEQSGSGV